LLEVEFLTLNFRQRARRSLSTHPPDSVVAQQTIGWPFVTNRTSLPSDPFALKTLSKWNPRRLAFTCYYRAADHFGRATYKRISECIDLTALQHVRADPGIAVLDTLLSSTKISLLLDAVKSSEELNEPIVEIGSYRGATTCALAAATRRQVFAVDPYSGYGSDQWDEHIFNSRASRHLNITHLRVTSGQALMNPECQLVSMVFIDAANDFANVWFNCVAWMRKVKSGGFVAVNTVDEWPGPNLACRRLLRLGNEITPWGYCEDLIVLRKLT